MAEIFTWHWWAVLVLGGITFVLMQLSGLPQLRSTGLPKFSDMLTRMFLILFFGTLIAVSVLAGLDGVSDGEREELYWDAAHTRP